ncbi:Fe(3+) ABC transporter substrate-binding protein [Oceanibaculum pacificum]|uniref:Fe(3+) ABC transporter substrate-binding protein n=1 Tax=Oceanibaculum pacificum TaxID=580166 RepID=A0A154WFH1_9PROT|nr:Fe(3+) ABC transporter substrate-binding protein [Oceanibaculum pacificum]KZD12274.1 Fe(3+) ABC transporter substrate-binding protein [Oceanibaculum pacificum]
MRHLFHKLALGAGVGLLALGAVDASAAEVNVYSARHYDTDNALYDNFTKQTGIKINIIEANADQLIERLKAEGQNSPADVLITVDAGRLVRAEEAGVLQPVKSDVLESRIPAYLRDPQGHWYGLTKRARVIIYSKDRVKPGDIATYEDLADPKWKGKLAIRSSTNVYNQSLVGSILAAHGEAKTLDWAKGIVANLARAPKGGDRDQIRAVAVGEADIAVSNTYYLGQMINGKPEDKEAASKVGVIFPNQKDRGTHVNISGGGVAKYAPNKENAVKFLEYLTTPEAQRYFAEGNYEYPVVAGAEIHPTLKAWGEFKEDELHADTFASNYAKALQITDQAGWK